MFPLSPAGLLLLEPRQPQAQHLCYTPHPPRPNYSCSPSPRGTRETDTSGSSSVTAAPHGAPALGARPPTSGSALEQFELRSPELLLGQFFPTPTTGASTLIAVLGTYQPPRLPNWLDTSHVDLTRPPAHRWAPAGTFPRAVSPVAPGRRWAQAAEWRYTGPEAKTPTQHTRPSY